MAVLCLSVLNGSPCYLCFKYNFEQQGPTSAEPVWLSHSKVQTQIVAAHRRGKWSSSILAKILSKYFEWDILSNWHQCSQLIDVVSGGPIKIILGHEKYFQKLLNINWWCNVVEYSITQSQNLRNQIMTTNLWVVQYWWVFHDHFYHNLSALVNFWFIQGVKK